MNQILLGASIPFIVSMLIYASRGFRASLLSLILTPMTMAISALWAIAPDIPRLLGMQKLYSSLSRNPKCDIFYWHYTIDSMESDSNLFLLGFVLLLGVLLLMAWRELKITEKERE